MDTENLVVDGAKEDVPEEAKEERIIARKLLKKVKKERTGINITYVFLVELLEVSFEISFVRMDVYPVNAKIYVLDSYQVVVYAQIVEVKVEVVVVTNVHIVHLYLLSAINADYLQHVGTRTFFLVFYDLIRIVVLMEKNIERILLGTAKEVEVPFGSILEVV